jgi:hypothetical protein
MQRTNAVTHSPCDMQRTTQWLMRTCHRALLARQLPRDRGGGAAGLRRSVARAASEHMGPHRRRGWACPRNTSAPGLGSPPPQSSVGLVSPFAHGHSGRLSVASRLRRDCSAHAQPETERIGP